MVYDRSKSVTVLSTTIMRPLPYLLLSFLLYCLPEPNGFVPAYEVYIYSGELRTIQDPFIEEVANAMKIVLAKLQYRAPPK
ncbi:MAG: hypothetical protein AAGJ18_00255 [Bacteroidota bacterium]